MSFRVLALLLLACPAPARPGVLEGVALDSATGRPLARAHIKLLALRNAIPQSAALTDSSGQFRFLNLPGEPYLLTAERTGYLTARYGQRRWNGAGTPIVIEASGRFFAEMRLRRLGAIQGQILDENQVGLPGVTVAAFGAGRQPLRQAASATSDDRGVFRIAGLEPGQYYLRTGALELEDHRGLLPTYLGQTTQPSEGRTVAVQLDSETPGARIEPLAGRLGRLTGHVTGGLASSVLLFTETGTRTVMPGPGGRFTFNQLAPGDYELLAQAPPGLPLAAWSRIRVEEGDNELMLQLAPPPTVRVEAVRSDGQPLDAGGPLVVLERQGLSQELPAPAISAEHPARIPPGEYLLRVHAPPEYWVQSVRLPPGGMGNRFTLTDKSFDIVVTLAPGPAKVHGTVRTPDGGAIAVGAPVFVNAVDPEVQMRMGGARLARTGEDGGYEFSGLPPGQYLVLSSFDFETPEEVDWHGAAAKSVFLEEDGNAAVDLVLGR